MVKKKFVNFYGKKILLGIRTNNFDYQTRSLAYYYMANCIDVVIIVDETNGSIDTGFFNKVSITKDKLINNGLFHNHSKICWLCGDYFLYQMMMDYPNYDGYWLVEDDALVAFKNLKEKLYYPILQNIDFAAYPMREAKEKFIWKPTVKKYYKKI